MQTAVLENGFAVVAGEVVVFNYDGMTKEYLSQSTEYLPVEAFSFGDSISVLDRRELLDYVECVQMDRWYEPPVSFDGLPRTYRAAVHHSSPI